MKALEFIFLTIFILFFYFATAISVEKQVGNSSDKKEKDKSVSLIDLLFPSFAEFHFKNNNSLSTKEEVSNDAAKKMEEEQTVEGKKVDTDGKINETKIKDLNQKDSVMSECLERDLSSPNDTNHSLKKQKKLDCNLTKNACVSDCKKECCDTEKGEDKIRSSN